MAHFLRIDLNSFTHTCAKSFPVTWGDLRQIVAVTNSSVMYPRVIETGDPAVVIAVGAPGFHVLYDSSLSTSLLFCASLETFQETLNDETH